MITCDYCGEKVEGAVTSILGLHLHPECEQDFKDEATKIRGNRPKLPTPANGGSQ